MQTNHRNIKNQTKLSINIGKKSKPTNIQRNNSSGKPLPDSQNYYRQQPPYRNNFSGRTQDRKISQNFSQK